MESQDQKEVTVDLKNYIDIKDAAELTGYSVKFLRKLVKTKKVAHHKSKDGLFILWSEVQRLAFQQKPFWVALPDKALESSTPDPQFLIHTKREEEGPAFEPIESFYNRVELGNCVDWMRRMPSESVQSVVTSPPYWGVRKYPGEQQVTWADGNHVNFGEEPTVEGYIAHTLEVLRHLKRILREDGTIWWNMGDTYQTRAYLRESSTERIRAVEGDRNDTWRLYPNKRYSSGHSYLKDKDLTMVPFMIGIGAEHLGFYVRSIIVWYKDNTVPEPVGDRPTTTHEYILLLAKSRFYKYDKARAAEASVTGEVIKRINGANEYEFVDVRNLRTVWKFPPSSRHGEHTAAFPIELPLRCLNLTTTTSDFVFDPFVGSGTTLAAASLLGCNYFGCDVDQQSVQDARRRILAPERQLRSNGKEPKEVTSKPKPKSKAATQSALAYSHKLFEEPSASEEIIAKPIPVEQP
jgi:DNA modification methylase